MVVHTCNPSILETEAGGSQVKGQSVKVCLKNKKLNGESQLCEVSNEIQKHYVILLHIIL
jgi:hypothetical protein